MSTVNLNGKPVFEGQVRSVMVVNGKVYVNDVDMTNEMEKISIQVIGNVELVKADICKSIDVKGEVGNIETQSGSVTAGNVTGSVHTMSGSIDCLDIAGDASTMSGSVFRK